MGHPVLFERSAPEDSFERECLTETPDATWVPAQHEAPKAMTWPGDSQGTGSGVGWLSVTKRTAGETQGWYLDGAVLKKFTEHKGRRRMGNSWYMLTHPESVCSSTISSLFEPRMK